ncbi:MAG TPA: UDP-N-acetylmuramoyl-L-alanine--D-glutamate ligase [Clostridiaceae bacterium]|nr:UDP-N-acetylmuramoyl-L-alanine--D-glutamate ligase [Clostridiaceae bacterium]
MNNKLAEFKNQIKDKKVAILGIGISNTPLAKYLNSIGVKDITVFDRADRNKLEPTLKNLEGLNIRYSLGENYLDQLKGFDIIFKTPVVRFDIPELVRERERGAVITSEMEVFLELCPAQVFGVTGSDGKTTTTTLIYNILKQKGYNCWLGGNIGTPLLDKIDEIRETDKVVLELSSFQLHTMKSSPDVSVVTNVSPNHLDVHKSMEEYTDAKKNIFRYQTSADRLVVNYDNEITRKFADDAKGKTVFFSSSNTLKEGAFLKDGYIVYRDSDSEKYIVDIESILLPGMHNVENYLAATAAVIDYVEPGDIEKVAKTFKGVEHRMELVREVGGVKFYNDSIGSSPSRTIAGLKAFKQKVILIAGGYDKNISYEDMGTIIVDKVKKLILLGPTAPKIAAALENEIKRTGKGSDIPVIFCKTYEEAVENSYRDTVKGDIVVLSPASASFDMFKNFEERGNKFKELVNML